MAKFIKMTVKQSHVFFSIRKIRVKKIMASRMHSIPCMHIKRFISEIIVAKPFLFDKCKKWFKNPKGKKFHGR